MTAGRLHLCPSQEDCSAVQQCARLALGTLCMWETLWPEWWARMSPGPTLSWVWGEWSGNLVRGCKSLSAFLAPSSLLVFCGDRTWKVLCALSPFCLAGWLRRPRESSGQGQGCSHPDSEGSWSWRKPFQMLSFQLCPPPPSPCCGKAKSSSSAGHPRGKPWFLDPEAYPPG